MEGCQGVKGGGRFRDRPASVPGEGSALEKLDCPAHPTLPSPPAHNAARPEPQHAITSTMQSPQSDALLCLSPGPRPPRPHTKAIIYCAIAARCSSLLSRPRPARSPPPPLLARVSAGGIACVTAATRKTSPSCEWRNARCSPSSTLRLRSGARTERAVMEGSGVQSWKEVARWVTGTRCTHA